MPGLFGFIDKLNNQSDRNGSLLRGMKKSLCHFDYFNSDTFADGALNAGFVSWDKNSSDAIFVDKKNGLLVIYEGDVFEVSEKSIGGFRDSRGKTAEIIARLFLNYGERFVEYLNGTFNVLIYDFKTKNSYIFNDRFGYRHLYYYFEDGFLIFSPEIKSFLNYKKFDNSIDSHGLSDYFVYSYQLSDRTFFKKVKLLPPASVLKMTADGIEIKSYWAPKYTNSKTGADLAECIDEGYELFMQSVHRCLGESRKILVPISGGLDSRLILFFASQSGVEVTPVTFGARKCMDYQYAKRVCSELGLPSPELVDVSERWCREFADDLIWLSEAHYGTLGMSIQHGLARQVRGPFDRSLNGLYGGHLSFGSPYYNNNDLHSRYTPQERTARLRKGFNGHRYSLMENALSPDVRKAVSDYADETMVEEWERSESVSDQYVFRQDYIFLYNRIRRGMNNLNQIRIFYNDRQPFASYELFDFYLSLSPELALNHHLYKEIYKKKLPRLANIPWQQTGLNLYREPTAWMNFRHWFMRNARWYLKKFSLGKIYLRDPAQYSNQDLAYQKDLSLQQWLEDILLSERCLDRGYYSKQGLIEMFNSLKAGKNLAFEFDKLMMFELWNRRFVDGEDGGGGH